MTGSGNEGECGRVRELVVWLPAGTLGAEEQAEVQKHVAVCPACADLLKFASTLKTTLREQYASHPEPETLVRFAGARADMDPDTRARLERHLAGCPQCKEEVAMLEVVDRDDSAEASRAEGIGPARVGLRGEVSWLGSFWNLLRGSILKPVPAAVYLVLAAVGIGLYVAGPARQSDRISTHGEAGFGVLSGPSGISGSVGGVVILSDQTARMRQPGWQAGEPAEIDAATARFLLLELTGLEAPPAANDRYTVELTRDPSETPIATASVLGVDFSDNYTICLSLATGGLRSGPYSVRVLDQTGGVVFQSSIVAE
jgi:hypothetical protein